jgi:drug/metabolite transporter (DMT)-like permease
MITEILSKILSESLLSLYPIFVKKIQLPFGLHLWSRFFIYTIISFFFIDWKFVFENILSTNGILLSLVTIMHVFFSYRGFQLLESGIAYICFYTYPIMILLLSGEKMNYITILFLFMAIFGIYLLYYSSFKSFFFNQNDVNLFMAKLLKEFVNATVTHCYGKSTLPSL